MTTLIEIYSRFKEDNLIDFVIWLSNLLKNNKGMFVVCFTIFSLLFTIFNFFAFAVGYIFLYGFFFGGIIGENSNSVMEIFINPVPFNFYSVIIIGYLVVIGAIYFYLILKIWKYIRNKISSDTLFTKVSKTFWLSLSIVFLFGLIHLGLVSFFISGTDVFKDAYSFLYFWIVPGILFILVYWNIRGVKYIFASFSGILYSVLFLFLYSKYISNENLDNELFSSLLPYIIFSCSLIFTLFKKKYEQNLFVALILVFPFSTFSVYFIRFLYISLIKNQENMIQHTSVNILFIITSLVISIIISHYIVKKNKDHIKNKNKVPLNNHLIIISYQSFRGKLISFVIMIPILLLFLVFLLPKGLYFTSIYIREMANFSGVPLVEKEMIYIEDSLSKTNELKEKFPHKGYVISEKNGTYYIVNDKWKLERVSNVKIITMPTMSMQKK